MAGQGFFLPPNATAPGFEPKSVNGFALFGTFSGSSTNWVTALQREIKLALTGNEPQTLGHVAAMQTIEPFASTDQNCFEVGMNLELREKKWCNFSGILLFKRCSKSAWTVMFRSCANFIKGSQPPSSQELWGSHGRVVLFRFWSASSFVFSFHLCFQSDARTTISWFVLFVRSSMRSLEPQCSG